jgi:DNA topoisomerase-2
MAQNYMGSNNINLLEPQGQFGTRLHSGQDSASERYIFTFLNPITRLLFPEADDHVLTYVNDDGTIVEPEFYVPIIPFALINGISGIGTGFSCNIPAYNPKTVIEYLKKTLKKETTTEIDFVPYYEGFKGSIKKIGDQKYLIKGVYEKLAEDKIRITELPVGTGTMPYVTFLESLVDGVTDKAGKKAPPVLKDFTSISTEVNIDITVIFPKGKLAELEAAIDQSTGCNGVYKLLKLTTTETTTNMHMFNSEFKLNKYAIVQEIIDAFYKVRLGLYQKRKDYLIKDLEHRLLKMSNRARYIQETLASKIDLRRKTAPIVEELLTSMKFDKIDGDFKYLIKMPMDSVTEENVAHIMKEKETTEQELAVLKATPLEKIWLGELEKLETEYDKYKQKREKIQAGGGADKEKKSAVKTVIKKITKK